MNTSSTSQQGGKRRLILLGSTGSIGVNTLKVVDHLPGEFEVVGLAAGRNEKVLREQIERYNPQAVAVACEKTAQALRPVVGQRRLFAGADSSRQLVESLDADVTLSAIVGAAGLPATIQAIQKGMDIALANKETLVAAGELVMPLVEKHGVHLLPVDSEHSAIFQCLQTYNPRHAGGNSPNPTRGVSCDSPGHARGDVPVKRIVLTASGGPFRTADAETIRNATVEQALKHPTWNMGAKITIDSATMMNKALEIVEAHWLFGLRSDQIDVIVHPQSIAHSFVEFADHSVLAQLGPPDMQTPIQYALTWPRRVAGCSAAMDWTRLARLDFEPPDHERFPALRLAYRVIETGGTSGAILNAANEQAVADFLDRKISFGQITDLAREALDAIPSRHITSLQDVLEADALARRFVQDRVGSFSRRYSPAGYRKSAVS